MSYGFQAFNDDGYISVDENSVAYVYMGKWSIDVNNPYEQDIYVNCVGYPMVFFSVPYNTVNGGENSAAIGHTKLIVRAGIQMTRLRQANANTWVVTIRCNFVNGGNPGALYVRVFGQLHQNFPNGSGQTFGLQVWDEQGRLTFDAGLRMLRLAGHTYDTQITLPGAVPGDNERVDAKDTYVAMPFSMENKSIMANTRGIITYPYYVGSYVDFESGQTIDQYDQERITSLYWASGNTLYVRRVSVLPVMARYEGNGIFIIDMSQVNTVYSRVAVIDNNHFP